MAVPVVVAAASQAKDSSFLNTALKWLVTLLFIGIFVGLAIALYLLIDNWEPIAMFFTTGFIGWLNPFDSPDQDLTWKSQAPWQIPLIGPIFRLFNR